jgi:AcrR family transcriptional regulator
VSEKRATAAPKRRKKRLVRGEPVVRRTLNATLTELARAGFDAFRIDDVAARARVNKTTVYRRWPTKEALVRAALLSLSEAHETLPVPDTGSVREDLMIVVRRVIALTSSEEGRVTMRMFAAESPHSELGRIAESVRKGHDSVPLAILHRAHKRGELRAAVEPEFLFDVLRAACTQTILHTGEFKESFVQKLVDLILRGALASKPPNARVAVKRAARARR